MILWLIVLCALCCIVAAPALIAGFVLSRILSDADPHER